MTQVFSMVLVTETVDNRTAPATGLPQLIDLGAGKCIPCKKMAPILDELKAEYAGVLEVRVCRRVAEPGRLRDNIQLIPTKSSMMPPPVKNFSDTKGFSARRRYWRNGRNSELN